MSPGLAEGRPSRTAQTLAGGRPAFRADEPAFFSMVGVVIYLTRDAAMGTLKFVASLPAGSAIVLDDATPPSGLSEDDRNRQKRTRSSLRISEFRELTRCSACQGNGSRQ